MTGAFCTPAKFSASWKAPWLVAPSPKKATATPSVPMWRAASAAPTACGAPEATTPLVPNRPMARS